MIWRLRWGEEWLYVYLLLEFQSTINRFMAVRVMVYLGLLYQDLIKTKQLTRTGRLPPVLPVVLYNGKPRWTAAEDSKNGSSARNAMEPMSCLFSPPSPRNRIP